MSRAEDLVAYFEPETKWRPDLAKWIVYTERRTRSLEKALRKACDKIDTLEAKLAKREKLAD